MLLFLLLIFIFWFIGINANAGNENNFDQLVYNKFSLIISPSLTRIMLHITFFGSRYFLLPAYTVVVCYFLFINRQIKQGVCIALIGIIGDQILWLMKDSFHRARPPHPLITDVTDYSYPSGHSFASFTFYGLLVYIIWKSNIKKQLKMILSILFFVICILIITSRVYLHVHYTTDVIGGFCLSLSWLIFSLSTMRMLNINFKQLFIN